MNTISMPTADERDIQDPIEGYQSPPAPEAQSFVRPSATPAWQEPLMGQDQTVKGVTTQIGQAQARFQSQQQFKKLLDQGDKLADMVKQDAQNQFPQKLSNGAGVETYLPPKEMFVDHNGNFDGFKYSKHALVGIYEFQKDWASDQAAHNKQQNTEERLDLSGKRVKQGQDRLDLAGEQQALREAAQKHREQHDGVMESLKQAEVSIQGGKLTSSISLGLSHLKTTIDKYKEDADAKAKKAQAKADMADGFLAAGKDANGLSPGQEGFTTPVTKDQVDALDAIAADLKSHVQEWKYADSTYNQVRTLQKQQPVQTITPPAEPAKKPAATSPLTPKGSFGDTSTITPPNVPDSGVGTIPTGNQTAQPVTAPPVVEKQPQTATKPIPPKGSPERAALIQQAHMAVGNDPVALSEWFRKNGYVQ